MYGLYDKGFIKLLGERTFEEEFFISIRFNLAHRMAEMEKRRVGTRFLEREVTQSDLEKPFLLYLFETKRCSIM